MRAANLSQVHVWFSNFLTLVAVSGIERIGPVIQSELSSWLGNEDVLTVALEQWNSPNVQR